MEHSALGERRIWRSTRPARGGARIARQAIPEAGMCSRVPGPRMNRRSRWKRQARVSPQTKFRKIAGYRLVEAWREMIDEASSAILCSRSIDSDAAGEGAEAVHIGTGDERSVPDPADCGTGKRPRRLGIQYARSPQPLGGRTGGGRQL